MWSVRRTSWVRRAAGLARPGRGGRGWEGGRGPEAGDAGRPGGGSKDTGRACGVRVVGGRPLQEENREGRQGGVTKYYMAAAMASAGVLGGGTRFVKVALLSAALRKGGSLWREGGRNWSWAQLQLSVSADDTTAASEREVLMIAVLSLIAWASDVLATIARALPSGV